MWGMGVFVVSQNKNELAKRERERYSCVIRRYDICYDMRVIIHHPQKRTEAPLCLEALELGKTHFRMFVLCLNGQLLVSPKHCTQ